MITPSATTPPTGTAQQPQQPSADAKSGFAGGDFETFLKMLTTQIKNQDPLNPMEGADFAVQLATFSGVEQQVKTNELLASIAGKSVANDLTAYSDWIGRTARTTGQVHFGEAPLTLDIDPDPSANRVVLVAHDKFGRRIQEEEIGNASGLVDWYGVDSAGQRLQAGLYSFTLESYQGEKLLSQSNVPVYSVVQEVQRDADGISFLLTGGATARLDEIDALGLSMMGG